MFGKDNELNDQDFEDIYTIGKELGSGDYSVVYECVHNETKQEYAVKMIDKSFLSEYESDRVELEIQILKQCDHPCIIKMYEYYESSFEFYIVLELMKGGDLFQRIVNKNKYTELEAKLTLKNILNGINYLHNEVRVAHRDVKPENIMIVDNDDITNIKICDFGLAKYAMDDDLLNTPCGTTSYIAPEVLNSSSYKRDVDMWSVGVILYTLLAGFPPFYSEDEDELLDLVANGIFYFPENSFKHISAEAKDLICKLLEKDSSIRYTSEQALQHQWFDGLIQGSEDMNMSEINNVIPQASHIKAVNKVIDAHRDGSLQLDCSESSLFKKRKKKIESKQNDFNNDKIKEGIAMHKKDNHPSKKEEYSSDNHNDNNNNFMNIVQD